MPEDFYQFSNGIRIRRSDLSPIQIERYTTPGNPNLHEPVEEEWFSRVLDRIPTPSPVFLDVGAAMGYYCLVVKKLRPAAKIFAVEALPRHVDSLRKTLALNSAPEADITILQCAVGMNTGNAMLRDRGYGSHLLIGPATGPAVEVQMKTLAEILTETGPVDLMKMDIQGAESAVLGAAHELLATGNIRHLIVGTHGQQNHQFIRQLLSATGYQLLFDDPSPLMQPDGILVAARAPI